MQLFAYQNRWAKECFGLLTHDEFNEVGEWLAKSSDIKQFEINDDEWCASLLGSDKGRAIAWRVMADDKLGKESDHG